MTISKNKKPVKASTDKPAVDYSEAIDFIKSAIDALGDLAETGDALAKESIANLSVVLLDLK